MSFPILGSPKPQFLDAPGDTYSSGTLSVLEPADDTNKTYYPTADDADADTNGSTGDITLNSSGVPTNALFGIDDQKYKLVLKDSAGATIWTVDDIRLPTRLPTLYGKTAQTLTDAGAVTVTESATFLVTTTNSAITLADGVENQEKLIVMKTESGVATLTPSNFANGTTVIFDDVGDSAHLAFLNSAWHFMGGSATVIGGVAPLIHNHLGLYDPSTSWSIYFDDFHKYAATDWVITTAEAGAGSATEAVITNGRDGRLKITNAAGDNDNDFFQYSTDGGTTVSEIWKVTTGKRAMFKCKVRMADVDQTSMHIGLGITDPTPGGSGDSFTDGIFFRVDDNDTDGKVDFVVKKDSTPTVTSNIATMADDTLMELMWVYDENGVLSYYVDEVLGGTSVTTNLPDDQTLAISFGVQNGEAATNSLEPDFIYCAIERA